MKICLDYGHNNSGWDTGAVYFGIKEQDINFEIGKKLKVLLEQNGIEVVETRPNKIVNLGTNTNSSLQQRVKISNDSQVDCFISLHCNASPDKFAHGTETFIVGKGGKAEKLAECVNTSITRNVGTFNRNVKMDKSLYVIKNTNAPAILVEMAFLTNDGNRELLLNSQDNFAEAIAKGVCEFLGISYNGEGTNQYSYDNTVEHLIKLGITDVSNMAYWETALAGTKPLDKDNVRAIVDRLIKKCYE